MALTMNVKKEIWRIFLFLYILFTMAVSCNMNKVTKVEFTNENTYPVDFKVQVNNVELVMPNVAAGAKVEAQMDWTSIEQKDGQWIFWVKHSTTGMSDSFSHGYFEKGALCNFLTAASAGSQLKVKLME